MNNSNNNNNEICNQYLQYIIIATCICNAVYSIKFHKRGIFEVFLLSNADETHARHRLCDHRHQIALILFTAGTLQPTKKYHNQPNNNTKYMCICDQKYCPDTITYLFHSIYFNKYGTSRPT